MGFKPTTLALGVPSSVPLSYKDVELIYHVRLSAYLTSIYTADPRRLKLPGFFDWSPHRFKVATINFLSVINQTLERVGRVELLIASLEG